MLTRVLRTVKLNTIDKRSQVGVALRRIQEKLTVQLGGPEAVTPAQALVIEQVAIKAVIVQAVGEYILKQDCPVRGEALVPVVLQHERSARGCRSRRGPRVLRPGDYEDRGRIFRPVPGAAYGIVRAVPPPRLPLLERLVAALARGYAAKRWRARVELEHMRELARRPQPEGCYRVNCRSRACDARGRFGILDEHDPASSACG
jgi:hypothetical protein